MAEMAWAKVNTSVMGPRSPPESPLAARRPLPSGDGGVLHCDLIA